MPDLLTVAEVAAFAGRSETWVRLHASGDRQPRLPSICGAKKLLFRRDDVRRLLAQPQDRANQPRLSRRERPVPVTRPEEATRIIPGWHEPPEPCITLTGKISAPCHFCGRKRDEMHAHGTRFVCGACCREGR